jgi:hypothetical protein
VYYSQSTYVPHSTTIGPTDPQACADMSLVKIVLKVPDDAFDAAAVHEMLSAMGEVRLGIACTHLRNLGAIVYSKSTTMRLPTGRGYLLSEKFHSVLSRYPHRHVYDRVDNAVVQLDDQLENERMAAVLEQFSAMQLRIQLEHGHTTSMDTNSVMDLFTSVRLTPVESPHEAKVMAYPPDLSSQDLHRHAALWYDLHGTFQQHIFADCVNAVLGALTHRPGSTAASICRRLLPLLTVVELEQLLDCLERSALVHTRKLSDVTCYFCN